MTYGFLVAQGNGIRRTGRLGAADIVDIAPTILRLQGLPLPGHLEGHPLEDMLETGA
jgi:arylsulfatase A-like enzyme